MNQPTPLDRSAVIGSSDLPIVELSRRDRLRAELLAQLPELALTIDRTPDPAGLVSDIDPDLDLYDQVTPDTDYNPRALAEWILAQFDAEHLVVDQEQTRAIEMSGAAGVISASAEFMSYLAQLAAVLKQGHSLAGLWDLARSIHLEVNRLQQLVAELLVHYPELQHLDAGAPKTGLVTPAD